MQGMHHPLRQRKLEQRRFLNPFYPYFTIRNDGKSWPRHNDTLRNAPHYVEGILSPGRRKTMRGIAKRVEQDEDHIQRFITESPWTYEGIQTHLNHNLPQAIDFSDAAIVIDEFGLIKKGKHSVAVKRQYSGAAGKVENSQVAVNEILAKPATKHNADQHTWPLGMGLFVPESWIEDSDLREEVKMPDDVSTKTKPQIAMDLIQRSLDAGVPHACTVADALYGNSTDFREFLRDRKEPYALAITPKNLRVILDVDEVDDGEVVPEHVFVGSPLDLAEKNGTWKTVEWAEGEKDVLSADFARWHVRVVKTEGKNRIATDEVCWLLVERIGEETKAYLVWGMDKAKIEKQVKYVHIRWTIEKFHRDAKQELAMDCFEGRSWNGWHHHMTMVMLAYAYVATLRAEAGASGYRPPRFNEVLSGIYVEKALRLVVEETGMSRREGRRMAERIVKVMTDYG